MAVTVKRITLWRKEVPHQVGVLAGLLEPLAQGLLLRFGEPQ